MQTFNILSASIETQSHSSGHGKFLKSFVNLFIIDGASKKHKYKKIICKA